MSLNPLDSHLASLQKNLHIIREQQADLSAQLSWFGNFGADATNKLALAAERDLQSITLRFEDVELRYLAQRTAAEQYKGRSNFGIDPRYWFSPLRVAAKRQHDITMRSLIALRKEQIGIKKQIDETEAKLTQASASLSRYRAFDELSAKAIIHGSSVEQKRLELAITQLMVRKAPLDAKLAGPTKQLDGLWRLRDLATYEIEQAERFIEELERAPTSRDRAIIHQRCEDELGSSKPSQVIREKNDDLRRAERDIEKLRARVNQIIAAALREVETLVIDGNNLCYQQDRFIGLDALEALVPEIARRYRVILVFDSGIRGLLRLGDAEIRQRFSEPSAVHIVASKTAADETIIDVASTNRAAYIISCDRYIDFMDKEAVAENRLIRHEIIDNMVLIHDLDISVKFGLR